MHGPEPAKVCIGRGMQEALTGHPSRLRSLSSGPKGPHSHSMCCLTKPPLQNRAAVAMLHGMSCQAYVAPAQHTPSGCASQQRRRSEGRIVRCDHARLQGAIGSARRLCVAPKRLYVAPKRCPQCPPRCERYLSFRLNRILPPL